MDTLININTTAQEEQIKLLSLLQLVSPALPVGAYSYSEGLETLIEISQINNPVALKHWLVQELYYGAIRLESAVMLRAYHCVKINDLQDLSLWNAWLSAAKETEELRHQSLQMGRSLLRLYLDLQPEIKFIVDAIGDNCNYAIAFGIAAAHWQIDLTFALLGYLQSWATNLINVAVKLIPMGQTSGQKLLLDLQTNIYMTATEILHLKDDDLHSCGWGLALASMQHETLYTRLFRS